MVRASRTLGLRQGRDRIPTDGRIPGDARWREACSASATSRGSSSTRGIPTTPDARGRLFVDVDRVVGPFAYVNLLDLQADP